MPLHIGDAYIKILVQMDGLIKGMREAESITRQSAAGMQSALDSSTASMQQLEQAAQETRSAAGWLGAALGGLAAAGTVTMKNIASTAMRTQELGIVLGVVSRNAEVATETTDRLEAEMKELGMTTQASRTIITRMIQTNVDLSKATDLVRVAQDMAVISMEDSSTAAQGLMRAIVTMNPILLRKYGIMTGLEDIDRRAGEALGILTYETEKSGKVVKKWAREITAAERQQAIFNMILEEGGKFAGTYTDAMDAPGKAMRSFSRYIMEAQEAIGDYWLPALNQAIVLLTKLVKAFNNASPELKKFIAIALPVGTALASLAGSALLLYSQWGRILPVIKGVTALLSGLVAPVAAVITIVAALGAAWHFNWGGIQEKTATAIATIRGYLDDLLAAVQSAFEAGGVLGVIELFGEQIYTSIENAFGPEAIAFLEQFISNVVSFGQDIVSAVQNVIAVFQEGGIVAGLQEMVTQGLSLMQSFIETFGDQLALLGQALIDWIGPKIPIVLQALKELANSILVWIGEQAPGFLTQLETWGRAFVEWVTPRLGELLAQLGELAGRVLAWAGEQIPVITSKLAEWGQAFIDWIAPLIPPLLAKLGELAGNVIEWIGEQIPVIAAKALEWGQAFVDWVGPKIPIVIDALGGLITNILVWIVEQIPVLIQNLAEWGTQFIEWITPIVEDILPKLGELLGSILTWIIGTAVPAIIKETVELASALVGWITDTGPEGAVGQVPGALQTFLETLGGFIVETLIPALIQFGINMVSGLLEGLEGAAETLDLAKWASDVLANIQAAIAGIWEDIKAVGKSIIDGIIAGISAKTDALRSKAEEIIGMLPQWARNLLGAGSPSTVFFEIGLDMMRGLAEGIEEGEAEVLKALAETMTAIIDAMGAMVEVAPQIARYPLLSDFKTGVDQLVEDTEYILRVVRDELLDMWSWKGVRADTIWGHMESWADAVDGILGVLDEAVETFAKIADYEGLMPKAVDILMADIATVLHKLEEIMPQFEDEGLYAASQFADIAGAIVEALGGAIDTLIALADFAPSQADMRAGIDAFFASLEYFLDELAWGMWRWEDLASEKTVEIAELLGQTVTALGTAIQPLLDIAEYAPDQATFHSAVNLFFANLEHFLDEFAWGMWRWEDLVSEKSAELAELIGRTLAGLSEAIQPLLDIADYSITPGEAERATQLFFQSLEIFLDTFAWQAEKFEAKIDPALTALAESIGALVSGIGAAVGPLMELAQYGVVEFEYGGVTFKTLLNLEEVQRSFDLFFLHLGMILADFEEASKEWEVSKAAQVLAAAVAELASSLNTALQFLNDVAVYGAETADSAARGFQTFLRDIKRILSDLEEANETMGPALIAAKEFALATADVLSAIQEGINDLNSLSELEEMPDLVEAGISLIKSLEDGMLAQVDEAILTAVTAVKSIVDAIILNCESIWRPQLFDAGIGLGSILIDGMIAGLIAQKGALYSTIQQIIQNAIAVGNAAAGAVPAGLGGLGGLATPMAVPEFATPGTAGTHHHYELEYHAHRAEVGEEDAARAMRLIEFRNRWK